MVLVVEQAAEVEQDSALLDILLGGVDWGGGELAVLAVFVERVHAGRVDDSAVHC